MITSSIIAASLLLHSLSEINVLPDVEFAQAPEFALTGTVTALDMHSDFAFADDSGRAFIYLGTASPPHAGDRVIVLGRAHLNELRYRRLQASSITILSSGIPPTPVDVSLAEATSGSLDYHTVRVKGRVTDLHEDELSKDCQLLTMTDEHEMAIIPVDPNENPTADYLNADITVTGIIRPVYKGSRIFSPYLISQSKGTSIELLSRPPADRFTVEELGDLHHVTPQRISKLGYRRIFGRVCAIWNKSHVLVNTVRPSAQPIHVILRKGMAPPACGDVVDAVGCVETDLFSILLSDAEWRPATNAPPSQPASESPILKTSIRAIARANDLDKRRFNKIPIGMTVEIEGTVRRVPRETDSNRIFTLESEGSAIEVDASMAADAALTLTTDSIIRVRGIYLLLAERWHPTPRFPNVYNAQIILRNADDIDVISTPPWWTPQKLVIALVTLALCTIGILIWNRILNRIVERRSRALLKERLAHDEAELKKEERTKLAVELHDSLSQNLTGIAFQLDVAELTAENSPEEVLPHLRQIRLKMQSCRDNLKNCLWDLRNLALDQTFLADALRETLVPVIDQTEVTIDFPVRNSTLDDSIVHAIICIVRELAVNAIRHGKATRIDIVGRQDTDGISMKIRDNGNGFDPERRQGTAEGHFGLQGVSERVTRFNGEMDISSRPGKGTEICIRGLHEDA